MKTPTRIYQQRLARIKELIIAPVWPVLQGYSDRDQTHNITNMLLQEWPMYRGDRDMATQDARAALKQFRKYMQRGPLEGLDREYPLIRGGVKVVRED